MQNGVDTVNFRSVRDSKSLDQFRAVAGSPKVRTPGGTHEFDTDENPFQDFNSVTRAMDGDWN